MEKTIWITIGIIFAVIAMGVILRTVQSQLKTSIGEGTILSIQPRIDRDMLDISWQTRDDMDGAVHHNGSGQRVVHDARYSRVHRVRITELSGDVEYYLESCDIEGNCVTTEPVVASFVLQRCADGTPYGRCSDTRPSFCNNGVLVDDCGKCGCDLGRICETNGMCTLV